MHIYMQGLSLGALLSCSFIRLMKAENMLSSFTSQGEGSLILVELLAFIPIFDLFGFFIVWKSAILPCNLLLCAWHYWTDFTLTFFPPYIIASFSHMIFCVLSWFLDKMMLWCVLLTSARIHISSNTHFDLNYICVAAVRKEISDETDRETGRTKQISSVPIHLSIYSPNGKNLWMWILCS